MKNDNMDANVGDVNDVRLKLHGTRVSQFTITNRINDHDLFLVTQISNFTKTSSDAYILNDYFDGRFFLEECSDNSFIINEDKDTVLSGDRNSYAVEFRDISSSIHQSVIDNIQLGSMSKEDKEDYSTIEHNHDDIYSKFNLISKKTELCDDYDCLLMTVSLSDFSEIGTVSVRNINVVYRKQQIPKIKYDDIGTVKFVVSSKLDDNVILYDDKYNVDIFSDDFDGWVYPNGTTFAVEQNEFEDACEVYSESKASKSFTVPNLQNFIKLNPGKFRDNPMQFFTYQNALPPHNHTIENVKVDGKVTFKSYKLRSGGAGIKMKTPGIGVCGYGNPDKDPIYFTSKGTGTIDSIRFTNLKTENNDGACDIESKPIHNLMPLKVFIGFKWRIDR